MNTAANEGDQMKKKAAKGEIGCNQFIEDYMKK